MAPKQNREVLLQHLETLRKTKVLIYETGNRPGWKMQIHQEVHSFFAQHPEKLLVGPCIPNK